MKTYEIMLAFIIIKMCLTLGGGAPKCEPAVPPTDEAKRQRTILMICGFVHLALSIMLCFVNFMSGIYELIDVAILFCALAQMNFCCLTFYMVYISINFFTYFNIIGLVIQNNSFTTAFNTGSSSVTFWFTTICLLSIYYIVAVILCFFAYREFKGMMFDHGMGGNFGMGGMAGGGQQQQQ
jgi:hypothetical protein